MSAVTFEILPIDEVPVHELEIFEKAGITLVSRSLRLLSENSLKLMLLPEGQGTGRLLNLLQWDVGESLEYVDGDGPFADQVVHFAMHHLMDHRLGKDHPHKMLLAEAVASASDFYLLGKLIQKEVDTDFVLDTIDSLASYYEQYADNVGLKKLLEECGSDPFVFFGKVAAFLYEAVRELLYIPQPEVVASKLISYQKHALYPLLHHFNIANWVLTIRSFFRQAPTENWDAASELKQLFASEVLFLELV